MRVHPDIIRQALEKGLIAPDTVPAVAPAAAPATRNPQLVEACFAPPGAFVVPCATVSESNARSKSARIARTIAVRRAVSRLFGRHLAALAPYADHFHAGGVLRVTFVRLGGHRMDRSNLPGAMKAVEDAVCLMLGADDGAPNWLAVWEQQPGAPAGVRITLEMGA